MRAHRTVLSHPSRGRGVLAPLCLLACAFCFAPQHGGSAASRDHLVFATFAETPRQLDNTALLAESVRTFAGALKDARLLAYAPAPVLAGESARLRTLDALHVETRTATAPRDALAFPFARKVFAAAQAETELKDRAEVLAWMDDDTIVLEEPREFLLASGVSLAFRPVTHQRIGSLYDEPADAFWTRVYDKLSVPAAAIFPVVTPADNRKLRAYFNAGLLVVRPERAILRRWATSFPILYRDAVFADWCRQDQGKNLFLHQAALAGAVLGHLDRREMVELDLRYNFPLFFKEMFGAEREFHSIADVVTLRHESYFRSPAPGWENSLAGPPEKVKWIRERFAGK